MKILLIVLIIFGSLLTLNNALSTPRPSFSTPTNNGVQLIERQSEQNEILKKWFFFYYNKRTEVSFINEVSTTNDVITELFKAILVSFRVMENADENKSHICLYAFPNLPEIANKNNIKTIETNINEFLIQSKLLLQPDYQYSTQLIVDDKGDFPLGLSLLLLVEGIKTKVCI